jgi:hypothetical protein
LIDISKSPHRVAIISVSCVITASLFVSVFYFLTPVPWCKELCTQLLFPAIYSISGGLAVIWAGEESVKTLLRLRERISHGLTHKRILLAGDEQECANVEAQLRYSQLFNKNNITNKATLITPKYNYDFGTFTEYDLVILCFSRKLLKTITVNEKPCKILNDEQTKLLTDTLASIGSSKTTQKALIPRQNIVGLITLCPPGSLHTKEQKDPFERPFTVVVNQIGRMMTDIFSLLTTLPPRY